MPFKNEIDFLLLIIRSTSIGFSKQTTQLFYIFCTFLRRFIKEASCIKESCKSVEYLENAYLRVKVEKMNFEICKKKKTSKTTLNFFIVLVLI